MVDAFKGSFTLVDNGKNFDCYMKELGVNAITRGMANLASSTVTFTHHPDGYIEMDTSSTVKSQKLKFKLGQEIDETTLDGRVTKTKFTLEDGKLVQTQNATKPDEKSSKITREIKGDKMLVTCESGTINCVRTYAKK